MRNVPNWTNVGEALAIMCGVMTVALEELKAFEDPRAPIMSAGPVFCAAIAIYFRLVRISSQIAEHDASAHSARDDHAS